MKTFKWDVAINSSAKTKFLVKKVKFGEGYEQRQPQGFSPVLEKWSVSITNRKEFIDEVRTFLDAHGGYKAFLWRPTSDEPYKKYIATEYQRTPKGGAKWVLQWEMQEVLA